MTEKSEREIIEREKFVKDLLVTNNEYSGYLNEAVNKLAFLHWYFNNMIESPVHADMGCNDHNCAGVKIKQNGVDIETIGVITDGYYIPQELAFSVEALLFELYSKAKKLTEGE